MLNQIKLFFEQHLALSAPEETTEEKMQLATIALFLEMMHMDDKVEPREQEIIHEEVLKSDKLALDTIIFKALGLSDHDVQELYGEASKYVKDRQEKSDPLIIFVRILTIHG